MTRTCGEQDAGKPEAAAPDFWEILSSLFSSTDDHHGHEAQQQSVRDGGRHRKSQARKQAFTVCHACVCVRENVRSRWQREERSRLWAPSSACQAFLCLLFSRSAQHALQCDACAAQHVQIMIMRGAALIVSDFLPTLIFELNRPSRTSIHYPL